MSFLRSATPAPEQNLPTGWVLPAASDDIIYLLIVIHSYLYSESTPLSALPLPNSWRSGRNFCPVASPTVQRHHQLSREDLRNTGSARMEQFIAWAGVCKHHILKNFPPQYVVNVCNRLRIQHKSTKLLHGHTYVQQTIYNTCLRRGILIGVVILSRVHPNNHLRTV